MKNRTCAVVPCVIAARLAVGVGLCATTMGFAAAALPTYSFASNSVGLSSSQLPPVRTSLTKEKAEQMAGCEAEVKDENGVNYIVIKPKGNATEGIISADLKPDDFKAIQNKLSGTTLKFEGKVHGYGNISGLFSNTGIESLGNIGDFDVSNVTDMSYMFRGCKYLQSLEGLEKWNTSNVTNMNSMFSSCFFDDFDTVQQSSTFLNPISNWDVSNVTDMGGMFYFGKNLENINALGKWDTSNVKNMKGMFSNCKKLKNLDGLKSWKTSDVADMSYMFEDCISLLNINGVANWNTGNVTNMQEMFARCLQSVKGNKAMCTLFPNADYCKSSVSNLEAVKNWDVSKVTNMDGMFTGSETLTDISALKNWKFNKDLPYIDLGYLVTGDRISEDLSLIHI